MDSPYKFLLDRSEVWALLIPLAVAVVKKPHLPYLKPIIYYLIIALVINSLILLIWQRNKHHWDFYINKIGDDDNNNFLYNIHSIVRLLLFSWFFILLKQPFLTTAKKIIPILFLVFAFINFIFSEKFVGENLSSRLLSIETGILLFYCLQYYLYLLKEELTSFRRLPSFWIVTGLSLFVVASFPVFLFYERLPEINKLFSV